MASPRSTPGTNARRLLRTPNAFGHCTCNGDAQCPNNPYQICRTTSPDNNLCACDYQSEDNPNRHSGCATGQACYNYTSGINWCYY